MKNFYKLTFLFIFISITTILIPSTTYADTSGTVTATSLNVRSAASTTATTIGTLKKNAPVTITKVGKEWHEIKFNNKKGFVMAKYVSIKKVDTKAPTVKPVTKRSGVVNATILNVREKPIVSAKLIGQLKKNQKVTIDGTEKDWIKLTYNNKTGYILAKYVNVASTILPTGTIKPPTGTNNNSSENANTSTVNVGENGIVTTTPLNIRKDATTSSAILGILNKGDNITITENKDGFYGFIYNNQTAYVGASYIFIGNKLPGTQPTDSGNTNNPIDNNNSSENTNTSTINVGKNGIVTTTPLNIRADATTSSSILGTLNKGDSITITENKDGFYGFIYNNQTAYVGSSYIFIGDKLPEIPVTTNVIATAISSHVISVYKQADTTNVIGSIDLNTSMDIVEKLTDWYRVKFNDSYGYVQASDVIITSGASSSTSLVGKIIMLDAGHGGSDPGAIGNGLKEKDVTLDVVTRLKTKLENDGATVILTRSGDTYPSLQDRAKQSSNSNADIFVSVHANKAGTSTANGIEVFYYTSSNTTQKSNSSKLATAVQKHLVEETGLKNRGVKTANWYVIKYNNKPGILAEIGFLSGDQDSLVLGSDEGKDSVTDGLYLGIVEYFASK